MKLSAIRRGGKENAPSPSCTKLLAYILRGSGRISSGFRPQQRPTENCNSPDPSSARHPRGQISRRFRHRKQGQLLRLDRRLVKQDQRDKHSSTTAGISSQVASNTRMVPDDRKNGRHENPYHLCTISARLPSPGAVHPLPYPSPHHARPCSG